MKYVPTESGRVGCTSCIRATRPGGARIRSRLVAGRGSEVAQDGRPEERGRLDQVRTAAALHPHRDPRDGALLFGSGVCVCMVVVGVVTGVVLRVQLPADCEKFSAVTPGGKDVLHHSLEKWGFGGFDAENSDVPSFWLFPSVVDIDKEVVKKLGS